MTPVLQTIVGKDKGNCFAACLASLLDMPCDEVPNFIGDDPGGGYWFDHCNRWLAERDLALVMIRGGEQGVFWTADGVLFIASVYGPRGLRHAVVMKMESDLPVLVHDPYPGEKCVGDEKVYFVYFLVAVR